MNEWGPQDVDGECNAHYYLGDDFGDNCCTMRCSLPKGHEDLHKETGKEFQFTWGPDQRPAREAREALVEEDEAKSIVADVVNGDYEHLAFNLTYYSLHLLRCMRDQLAEQETSEHVAAAAKHVQDEIDRKRLALDASLGIGSDEDL